MRFRMFYHRVHLLEYSNISAEHFISFPVYFLVLDVLCRKCGINDQTRIRLLTTQPHLLASLMDVTEFTLSLEDQGWTI
jgi:hypothetical protein